VASSEANENGRNPRHVYAVLRLDEFQGLEVPLDHKVTVKKIVWSEAVARAEVERLNQLQAGKGCLYFYQVTRLDPVPAGAGPAAGESGEVGQQARPETDQANELQSR
jgi:hypothetical protein